MEKQKEYSAVSMFTCEDEKIGYVMRRAHEHGQNLMYEEVKIVLDMEQEYLESVKLEPIEREA